MACTLVEDVDPLGTTLNRKAVTIRPNVLATSHAMILVRAICLGWIMLFVSGCNPRIPPRAPAETANIAGTQPIPVSPTKGDISQMTPRLPTPAGPGLQSLIDKAIADLAQRLTISVNEIILLEVKS